VLQYGLIGKSLIHSFSPSFFQSHFQENKIENVSYTAFEIENIGLLPQLLLDNPNIVGLNVTIPYKVEVCAYIDELFGPAAGLNVVNTLVIERNVPDFEGQKIKGIKVKGFNTDIYGFKESIKPLLRPNFERALILGTGASATSIAYVLFKLGIDTLFVSRNPQGEQEIAWEDVNEFVIKFHPFIINTTPIGQFPNIENKPLLPYSSLTDKHLLYDLLYNPEETAFLKAGKEYGANIFNGSAMLTMQALQSWKIWQNAMANFQDLQ
jgi:shikimate dehydrogenase